MTEKRFYGMMAPILTELGQIGVITLETKEKTPFR
jgi:hypothetical protein